MPLSGRIDSAGTPQFDVHINPLGALDNRPVDRPLELGEVRVTGLLIVIQIRIEPFIGALEVHASRGRVGLNAHVAHLREGVGSPD